jgi:hypothetical protein
LEENNLLHPSHHGFRSKHNTSTAILQTYDVWLEALENNEISAVVMLDMSAAFDVVDYVILLDKLKIHGIDDSGLSWFESYLSARSQQVYIDVSCPNLVIWRLVFPKALYWDHSSTSSSQMICQRLFTII